MHAALVLLASSLVRSPALAGGTLRVSGAAGPPGSEVTLLIFVDRDVGAIAGICFTLEWGSVASIEGEDAVRSLLPAVDSVSSVNVSEPGRLQFAAVGMPPLTGPANVASVRLKLDPVAPLGVHALRISQAEAFAADGQPVSILGGDGAISVGVGMGSLTVGHTRARRGEVATVEITVDELVRGLAGAYLSLDLADVAEVASASQITGGIVSGQTILLANTLASGTLVVALVGTFPGNGPGVLLRIPVRIKRTAPVGIHHLAVSGGLSDPSGAPLPVHLVAGELAVTGSGDVNGDDKLTVLDLVHALRIVAGLAEPSAQERIDADVDGNGFLTVTDVLMAARMLAGLAQP